MGLRQPDESGTEAREVFILVDGDSITRKLWEVSPGECVGRLERQLRSLAAGWPKTRLFIAWDGPNSDDYRRQLWPGYKEGRSDPGDSYRTLRRNVPGMTKKMGWANYTSPSAEADDVIGCLCKAAVKAGKKVVVVSADRDLFQLLTCPDVIQLCSFKTTSGDLTDTVKMTSSYLMRQYNLTAAQWPLYKALVGDPSDRIPGVSQIGEKTAGDMFREFPGLMPGNMAEAIRETRFSCLNVTQRARLKEAVEEGLLEMFVQLTTLMKLSREDLQKLG